ncbi:MAG: zinc ribbon domain-containing protein [Candidatus Hermodarchaeota archaeon]
MGRPAYIRTRKFGLKLVQPQEAEKELQQLYPERFIELVNQVGKTFQSKPKEYFQETSLSAIKKQVINNNPDLRPKDLQKGEADVHFNTRAVWSTVEQTYFAYRNKAIRDKALQHIAEQLYMTSSITPKAIISLFQQDQPDRTLIGGLKQSLEPYLVAQFPNWANVQPKWQALTNMVRQVRNRTCEKLPDTIIINTLKTFGEEKTKQELAQAVLDHFAQNSWGKSIEEYLIDLLMRKVTKPLKPCVKEVWTKNIQQGRPHDQLLGLKQVIYEFLDRWVQQHPQDKHQTATKLWAALTDPQTKKHRLKEYLTQAKAVWLETIRELDLECLVQESVEQFIQDATRLTSTGPDGERTLPHKRKVFQAVHRATPLKTFTMSLDRPPTSKDLLPSLLEFLKARFTRQAEQLIRPTLVELLFPTIQAVLAESSAYTNARPVFRRPGFSLDLADKQMYSVDLATKSFTIKFTKRPTITFTFEIQDKKSRHDKKSGKQSRLETFATGWKALNPTLVADSGRWYIHIPFARISDEGKVQTYQWPTGIQIRKNKQGKPVEEIIIAPDQGVGTYAAVSVMYTKSVYYYTPTPIPSTGKGTSNTTTTKEQNKGKRPKLQRKVLESKELAHYYLEDTEVLDVGFDDQTGRCKNGHFQQEQYIKRRTKDHKRMKRRGKGKLRLLQADIRQTQAQLNTITEEDPQGCPNDPDYKRLANHLTALWQKLHNILDTLAQSLAAKLRDITVFYETQFKTQHPEYQACTIRVQVEDLRWARFGARPDVGYYLAHNQILFFHSQTQQALVHLLKPHKLGVWRVNPRYSSKTCARCGYRPKNKYKLKMSRQGNQFFCQNDQHTSLKGKSYSCNADLNAARNIALFTPLLRFALQ